MTIDNLIYKSILQYPSLYYKPTMEESRLAVLNYYFLVIGPDMVYSKGKYTFTRKSAHLGHSIKCDKAAINRLKAGEPLYVIENTDVQMMNSVGRAYSTCRMQDTRQILFESDYIKAGYNYIKWGERVADASPECDTSKTVDIFPEKRSKIFDLTPYPFCMNYVSFIQINPHYKKYTYNTIDNITVDELRASIPLMGKDYPAAIVEVYTWALKFFESPEYLTDRYYGFTPDDTFIKKVQTALQSEQTLQQLCLDFALPWAPYKTVEEVRDAIVANNRANWISKCNKIIEAFQ